MAKRTYPIMLQPAEGGYGVIFPDLPGCVSFGGDYDTAISGAEEALSLHLEGLAEDGEAFPDATPMADLILDHPDRTADTVWALASAEAPDTSERVNIYMAKSLLERIDRFVGAEGGRNRSTFFSIAARRYLEAESGSLARLANEQSHQGADAHLAAWSLFMAQNHPNLSTLLATQRRADVSPYLAVLTGLTPSFLTTNLSALSAHRPASDFNAIVNQAVAAHSALRETMPWLGEPRREEIEQYVREAAEADGLAEGS